jgi:peptidoglycan/xylan/chitin deacetylase (PgdA/CDA1 family)
MSVAIHCLLQLAKTLRKGGVIINEHTPSRAELRRHVEMLGRSFTFIHHDDLPERISRPRGRPFCLLSFDDGKRSNATEVAPELERLGVPAVFYVVTCFLNDGTVLWFDRYKALLDAIGHAPVGLEPDIVKWLPHAMLQERLDRACMRHGVALDMNDDVRPMTWDQARSLAREGFTIGAHGPRHETLTCEPEPDALGHIEQSIAEVTFELGAPCVTFAFTNGNYTARLAQHAIRCGVRTVLTTEPLWVDGRCPLWRLPRLQLHPGQGVSKMELKLAIAATGLWLADPNGTGRIYRKIQRLARRPSDGFALTGPGER